MPGAFLLPLILGLPLLGAIFVMCTPKTEHTLHRGLGLVFTVITFAVSLLMLRYYDAKLDVPFQLVFDAEWIPGLGARFKTGIDGISIFLVILTTFLMPLTLWGTGKSVDRHVREFIAAMLVLETGMIGAFIALDLFLFYVSWEVMLIPMYLLIGIWGGQRRLYASIKFVIYTMVGSLLMLVAIFYVYTQAAGVLGEHTTDLEKILQVALPYDAQVWCFGAFALAFAIKVPLFPLHTWLPDAHVEAPTAGSVILAGVLLKFGIFGFIRFAMPMFPHGAEVWTPALTVLAVVGIIYGALVAFAQDDVKKLVAYSSVSHLGFCMIGVLSLTTYGTSGSIYAMLSHGLTTGGLFLGIGVLYERRHTRRLAEYGGLWKQMPVFAGLYLIIVMGSAGLPALSGFVGEFLTLLGLWGAEAPSNVPMPKVMAALSTTGVILGAIYLLYMFQKVFFGKLDKAKNGALPDLTGRELGTFIPLVLGIILMGLFPRPFLAVMDKSVDSFVKAQKVRRAEPDGPAHRYGAAPKNAAALDKQLDEVAKGAAGAADAMKKVPTPPPPPPPTDGLVVPPPAAGGQP
jgi:NADH-quinone oxidoreductase subunit M